MYLKVSCLRVTRTIFIGITDKLKYIHLAKKKMTTSEETFIPIIIRRGNIISRARVAYRDKGSYYVLSILPKYLMETLFKTVPDKLSSWYYKLFKSSETFEFQGKQYRYFFHPYCSTWKNERCAIIPIVWDIIKKNEEQGKRVLELGNMLSYYYHVTHDILDKYEITDGVINEDVVSFDPPKPYDTVVSIMTLQEVGFKETPPDPNKFYLALDNLKRHTVQDGKIIIIHGIGENNEMDHQLRNGTLEFNKRFYIMRTSGHKWKEASWEDIKDLGYDHSIPTANGVVIGIIENSVNVDTELFKLL